MSNRGVAPSNDAFAGGAQQRNLYPPGVGGANLSANTRVSSPAAGVSPGQIKSALNNSTSNIGIPYTRLVPLNNSNKQNNQQHLLMPTRRSRLIGWTATKTPKPT